MKKVLLAATISPAFQDLLNERGYSSVIFGGQEIDFEVEGIVTSTKLSLDKETLSQFVNLKWIARLGSGIEIIDTSYCKEKGIAFASSPAGIANAVGEHCLAMLVGLKKNIGSSFAEVQAGQWNREPNRGWELIGETIGLIGYGHTAKAFAQKLKGFDCNIIAYDKYEKGFGTADVKEVSLSELQKEADVISFHVPANEETKYYYNHEFISECNPHIVMNTSRGDIVSTFDLLEGLENNKVLGAALDVLENEQFLSDSNSEHWNIVKDLLAQNVMITPHIAGYSYDAIEKMSAELMGKLDAII